jgi:hypothetical protein
MTTAPTPPGWADEPEPGWSPTRITPYGPGYSRYVPGKGMLQVRYGNGQYRWSLQTDAAAAMTGQDGFARGREAMRAADHWVRTTSCSAGAAPGRHVPHRAEGRGR